VQTDVPLVASGAGVAASTRLVPTDAPMLNANATMAIIRVLTMRFSLS
jgi:hypothetical protein